jgi:hypothetical protein
MSGAVRDINRFSFPKKVSWADFWRGNPGPAPGGVLVRLSQGIKLSGTACPAFTITVTRTSITKPNT